MFSSPPRLAAVDTLLTSYEQALFIEGPVGSWDWLSSANPPPAPETARQADDSPGDFNFDTPPPHEEAAVGAMADRMAPQRRTRGKPPEEAVPRARASQPQQQAEGGPPRKQRKPRKPSWQPGAPLPPDYLIPNADGRYGHNSCIWPLTPLTEARGKVFSFHGISRCAYLMETDACRRFCSTHRKVPLTDDQLLELGRQALKYYEKDGKKHFYLLCVGSLDDDLVPPQPVEDEPKPKRARKRKVPAVEPSAAAAAAAGGLSAPEQHAAFALAALPHETAPSPPRTIAPLLQAAQLLPPASTPALRNVLAPIDDAFNSPVPQLLAPGQWVGAGPSVATLVDLAAQAQEQHERSAAASKAVTDLLARCIVLRGLSELSSEPAGEAVRLWIASEMKNIADRMPAANMASHKAASDAVAAAAAVASAAAAAAAAAATAAAAAEGGGAGGGGGELVVARAREDASAAAGRGGGEEESKEVDAFSR